MKLQPVTPLHPPVPVMAILNLVMINQLWLKKMTAESGKAAKKEDFAVDVAIF